MKLAVAAFVVAVVGGLLALPLIAGATTSPSASACTDVGRVLETIRTLESGGNYSAQAAGSSASGAYQIIDSTWSLWAAAAGVGTEYPRARMAPPDVQDAVAAHRVQQILDQYNDVAAVPVAWYLPAALVDTRLMDIVPAAGAGNRLTPREYQALWLDVYKSTADDTACSTAVVGDGWALPVDGALLAQRSDALSAPHHDYPAWDFGVPIGTPVFAIRGGTVVHTSSWAGNCYGDRAGCIDACGTGVTVEEADGTRWIYCHASELRVQEGDQVTAGQQLMASGNTGNSSGPHVHVGLRVSGIDYCPQPILQWVAAGAMTTPPAPQRPGVYDLKLPTPLGTDLDDLGSGPGASPNRIEQRTPGGRGRTLGGGPNSPDGDFGLPSSRLGVTHGVAPIEDAIAVPDDERTRDLLGETFAEDLSKSRLDAFDGAHFHRGLPPVQFNQNLVKLGVVETCHGGLDHWLDSILDHTRTCLNRRSKRIDQCVQHLFHCWDKYN